MQEAQLRKDKFDHIKINNFYENPLNKWILNLKASQSKPEKKCEVGSSYFNFTKIYKIFSKCTQKLMNRELKERKVNKNKWGSLKCLMRSPHL